MTKIKFLQFYNTLDKEKAKDFKKFACSAYFNNGRDFKNLLTAVENIKNKNPGSKEFIKILSGNLGITSRTAWNRLHELMKIAEKFIVMNEIGNNKIQFENIAGRYFLNSGSNNLFEQKYKASIKSFKKSKKGFELFYHFYEVLQSRGYYYIFNNQGGEYLNNLTEQIIYHSASYMINHYLHLTEMLHQGNITAKELNQKGLSFLSDNIVESLLNTLKNEQAELYHILSFHYLIYKAFLTKNEDKYYIRAKESFNNAYSIIDDNYKTMFYQILINYCINRTNMHDAEYYNELFGLYNRKLEDGLYQDLKVGNFPINNFRDYIYVALQLEKIDWIKKFIKKYSPELPETIRNDEINLSYGIVYYHETDYDKSLEYLNKVAGENYIHYIDSKQYKLRLFYDTEKYEDAILEVDNYKHYLRAHKDIPDSFKKPSKILITEYSQLLNVKLKDNYEEGELLRLQLSTKARNRSRTWIIKKLDEFLGK